MGMDRGRSKTMDKLKIYMVILLLIIADNTVNIYLILTLCSVLFPELMCTNSYNHNPINLIILGLQIRKMKQSHTAFKWQSRDSNTAVWLLSSWSVV